MVCPRGVPLSVCSCGNQRTRHRHQVNKVFYGKKMHINTKLLVQYKNTHAGSFKVLPFSSSSSLSQWVHACDSLELPAQQREQLDSFIDQLYKDIEKGHSFISVLQFIIWSKLFLSQLSRFASARIVRASVCYCLRRGVDAVTLLRLLCNL